MISPPATTLKEIDLFLVCLSKMFSGSRPGGPVRVGPPHAIFDLPEREESGGGCLGGICHSLLKTCKSLNTSFFLIIILHPEAGTVCKEPLGVCQLDTLGLSSVSSASLSPYLPFVQSLDNNNKSMGFL